ncbi:MAG: hypothetical protein HQ579_06440 [Candidatus Omnitrophica bacterium]|nr:hypothetical protein [Candidatus Omnitrophota bacterium]
MKFIKILFISIVAIVLVLAVTFFFTKGILLAKIKTTIIKKVETAINRKIDVGGISYLPHKGLALRNLRIYRESQPKDAISIKSIFTKIDLARLFKSREIYATLILEGAKSRSIVAGGVVSIESAGFKKLLKPLENFALKEIDIKRIDVNTPYFNVANIKGVISFKENEISAPGIQLNYQNKPYTISFDVKNAKTQPDLNISLLGADLKAMGRIKKTERDLYVIEKSNVQYLDSHLECNGEISNLKNPILLLSGNLSLNTQDLSSMSPKLEQQLGRLNLAGIVDNEFYFRGPINNLSKWQTGLKSHSRGIKILDFALDDITLNVKMEDGMLSIPIFTAYPYGGVVNSSFRMNFAERGVPYSLHMVLKQMNINGIARHSQLKNSKLYGLLDSELTMDGYMADPRTIIGKGYIHIYDANLGPMPLLSPLVGNVYGVLRGMLPALKNVDIRGGACDFVIQKRKIMTENLILWGDALNIKARGYIDFDKNLNFAVENEIKEVDDKTSEGWRKTIVEMMSSVGKMIGKAYLTGTLDKPKWKFEYLGGDKNALGGKLQDTFKGLFE